MTMKKNMHGVLMCLAGLLMTAIFGFLQFGHPSAITAPVDEAGNSMSGSSALILMVVGLLIFAGGIAILARRYIRRILKKSRKKRT